MPKDTRFMSLLTRAEAAGDAPHHAKFFPRLPTDPREIAWWSRHQASSAAWMEEWIQWPRSGRPNLR